MQIFSFCYGKYILTIYQAWESSRLNQISGFSNITKVIVEINAEQRRPFSFLMGGGGLYLAKTQVISLLIYSLQSIPTGNEHVHIYLWKLIAYNQSYNCRSLLVNISKALYNPNLLFEHLGLIFGVCNKNKCQPNLIKNQITVLKEETYQDDGIKYIYEPSISSLTANV